MTINKLPTEDWQHAHPGFNEAVYDDDDELEYRAESDRLEKAGTEVIGPVRVKRINGYRHLWNGTTYRAEHRMVWEHAHGIIPDGYVIHHKNGIRTDNRIENLEMMTMNEHARKHCGGKDWWKQATGPRVIKGETRGGKPYPEKAHIPNLQEHLDALCGFGSFAGDMDA